MLPVWFPIVMSAMLAGVGVLLVYLLRRQMQLLREGRLGAIRHVRARYLQSWGGPATPLSWRFRKALAGSGAHGDLNAHIVDMALGPRPTVIELNSAPD